MDPTKQRGARAGTDPVSGGVTLSPSASIEVAFRRLRGVYWWALGLALGLHLLLLIALITGSPQGESIPEPAKVKFFTRRDPTLTKPLELRKVPQPQRQLVRRQLQPTAARMDQVRATAAFDTRDLILNQPSPAAGLANPSLLIPGQSSGPELPAALGMAGVPPIARTTEQHIDLGLEMLDINSMDTGRYRAMVIQDPKDRQSLKGFVKLSQVMSARAVSTGTVGWGSVNVRQVDALRDAVNEYTGLQADFIGSISYDDDRLLGVPVIIPQGLPNESEMAQLARYSLAGGFVIGDTWESEEGRLFWAIWGEALEKHGGLVQGRDFWNARLPDDHPLFTSFFDILGGMTAGYPPSLGFKSELNKWNYLMGYFVNGRLAGVSSCTEWGWMKQRYGGDSTRQLQVAVNIIIYALTQEGSMTQRLMQMVK